MVVNVQLTRGKIGYRPSKLCWLCFVLQYLFVPESLSDPALTTVMSHTRLTPKELQRVSDKMEVIRLLQRGYKPSRIVSERLVVRSRSWVFAVAKSYEHKSADIMDLLAKTRSGRPKKLTDNQKKTATRNLTKKGHRKKSVRQLEALFKSHAHENSPTVSQYVERQLRVFALCVGFNCPNLHPINSAPKNERFDSA